MINVIREKIVTLIAKKMTEDDLMIMLQEYMLVNNMKNINVTSEKDETVFDFKKLEKVKG
jgi:hypothetical protein